jgi:hypothetical protein
LNRLSSLYQRTIILFFIYSSSYTKQRKVQYYFASYYVYSIISHWKHKKQFGTFLSFVDNSPWTRSLIVVMLKSIRQQQQGHDREIEKFN